MSHPLGPFFYAIWPYFLRPDVVQLRSLNASAGRCVRSRFSPTLDWAIHGATNHQRCHETDGTGENWREVFSKRIADISMAGSLQFRRSERSSSLLNSLSSRPKQCRPNTSVPWHFPDNLFTYLSPLDFTRFSTASQTAGAALDWTADNRSKYFSLDGGTTILLNDVWSTAINFGNRQQASHWKDNRGIAIMAPRLLPKNWELFQSWIFVLLMRLDSIFHLSLLFLSLRPSDCWL